MWRQRRALAIAAHPPAQRAIVPTRHRDAALRPVTEPDGAAWSIYTDPAGTVFAINLAVIASHNFSEGSLVALADAFSPFTG